MDSRTEAQSTELVDRAQGNLSHLPSHGHRHQAQLERVSITVSSGNPTDCLRLKMQIEKSFFLAVISGKNRQKMTQVRVNYQ